MWVKGFRQFHTPGTFCRKVFLPRFSASLECYSIYFWGWVAGVPKFCFTACISVETMFLNTEAQYHHAHSLNTENVGQRWYESHWIFGCFGVHACPLIFWMEGINTETSPGLSKFLCVCLYGYDIWGHFKMVPTCTFMYLLSQWSSKMFIAPNLAKRLGTHKKRYQKPCNIDDYCTKPLPCKTIGDSLNFCQSPFGEPTILTRPHMHLQWKI